MTALFIVGGPVRGQPPVEGTRLIDCELCKQPARFAPSSLNRPEAGTAKFICLGCALKMPELEIGEPTPEQIRELHDALLVELAPVAVHILAAGAALCGLPGLPCDWPKGNYWVSYLEDVAPATCEQCREKWKRSKSSAGLA